MLKRLAAFTIFVVDSVACYNTLSIAKLKELKHQLLLEVKNLHEEVENLNFFKKTLLIETASLKRDIENLKKLVRGQ